MSNSAAIIPEAKALLEVQNIGTSEPGPHELLIKNELIALLPVDAKLAKLAFFPISYPAILGTSYGGTVLAVGPNVTDFKVGDRVAAVKPGRVSGNKNGAFQKYVIALDVYAIKVPESTDLNIPVGLIGNFGTVVGLFYLRLGLGKPDPLGKAPSTGKKVLIYGGTSSFGSLAVQYVAQAGYDVVTTTSPKHSDFVSKLGAVHVVDHTQDHEKVVKELVAEGPYDVVVDSISLKETFGITAKVVAAQGGRKLYALLPPSDPESIPQGVDAEYKSWSAPLSEEKNAHILSWAYGSYFSLSVAKDKLVALPVRKINGGLGVLNEALDVLLNGVSGVKVVVDPRE
ncbi:hypothetical protein EsH8_III_000214 [Colletotrichum jinshuiense]